MDIGKVIGTVVATRKDPSLNSTRLLVVQPLDGNGESAGKPLVATDTQGQAGRGDTIYMVTGRGRGWCVTGPQNARRRRYCWDC